MSSLESESSVTVPDYGWSRRADQDPADPRDQNLRPRLGQVLHLAPLAGRYALHWAGKVLRGRKPPIDQARMLHGKGIYGVPCGGIGAGTIGRGFRGEFTRFQIAPGMYSHKTVWADAFHLVLRNAERKVVFSSVLGSRRTKKDNRDLSSWQYNFKDENIRYHGLYPRSWTVFDLPELGLRLVCAMTSPFLPHNYVDSSLPVSIFEWSAENYGGGEDYDVTIAFSFKCGWGERKEDAALDARTSGFSEADFPGLRGRLIDQTFRGNRLTYAIAAEVKDTISVEEMADFDASSDGAAFRDCLDEVEDPGGSSSSHSCKDVAVAVKASAIVTRKGCQVFRFGLCWDMPEIKFRGGAKTYKRRYAQFFAKSPSPSSTGDDRDMTAQNILSHGFKKCQEWTEAIEAWQNPVLADPGLPDWLKSALFNELYYLADGGTQWLEFEGGEEEEEDPRKTFGRFAYLESHEYRLFNTYDVHFYASFALMSLFPGLQLSLQADFCDAAQGQDDTRITELYSGRKVPLNPPYSVPHDLGDPDGEPFLKVNAYRIHDISDWKDLNLKFVISVYRDIVWAEESKDENVQRCGKFLMKRAYPICLQLMESAKKWDKDQDSLIENGGKPDQTYDSWVMSGPSSYCNSLWIAALACMVELSSKSGADDDAVDQYKTLLKKAAEAFHTKLWDSEGKFFRFDTTPRGENTIMSDQLCGCWYLDFCRIGGGGKVFDEEKVSAALDTIYEYNVMRLAGGKMGAVNGMMYKEGRIDRSTVQSEEIWTGVTYALASLMVNRGKSEQGFRTAEGIYRTVYEQIGMAYETPEALYEEKHYRAIGYMRPLSIWSIYEAWRRRGKKS